MMGYDNASKSISVATGQAYTSTGTEMKTPFSGVGGLVYLEVVILPKTPVILGEVHDCPQLDNFVLPKTVRQGKADRFPGFQQENRV